MKMNLQEKKMKRIAELLSGNLSYIAGEREAVRSEIRIIRCRRKSAAEPAAMP